MQLTPCKQSFAAFFKPYSIIEGSLVSRMWSVRIHGIDISIGNWIRRPIVSSRKNSLNQSWERSQHCCRASEQQHKQREWNEGMSTKLKAQWSIWTQYTSAEWANLLCCFCYFHLCVISAMGSYSPLKLSRCVKKKDCLWKSSMATTMGPSRLLRSVFLDPLLSAISDSSIVRTM